MPAPQPTVPIEPLLELGWIVGALVLVGATTLQLVFAVRLTRRGEEVAVDPGLGLPAHTRIVRTDDVNVPMTLGFFRPTIIVPTVSTTWTEERLRTVLLHEGAHIRRGDWAWLVVARFLSCLYWPNPLVHWAAARLRVESELAADESVLHAGVNAQNYAATLVDLAESLRGPGVSAALPFVETGSLKERVAAILSGAGRLRPIGRTAAIGALLLVIAVVTPIAALRIVAGPEVVRDGVIDLGDGRHAEIVAITEMRDGHAVSWDVRGALLRHPFPVSEWDMTMFNNSSPHPAGAVVRYLVFRLDFAHNNGEMVSSSLDSLDAHDYNGAGGIGFEDALGGTYKIMQISAPASSRDMDLRVRIPGVDWKLYAFGNYRKGKEIASLNPAVDLHVAPETPAHGSGTKATFVLPPEFADQESVIRFLPGGIGGTRFVGSTGPMIASTPQPTESITRVEILARPLRSVVLANLPLAPDPHAVYVPRHFLPDKMVDANHGLGRLSDGTTLSIERISRTGDHPEINWDDNGNRVTTDVPYLPYPEESGNPTNSTIRMWVHKRTPKFKSNNMTDHVLYDGEGWPVFRSITTAILDGQLIGFYSISDPSSPLLDLATPIAVGPYRTVQRFERRGGSDTTWSFAERKDWKGSLHLVYPLAFADKVASMESQFVPLDAKGNPVPSSAEGPTAEFAPGWIEFNLTRADADRVVAVELRARPFEWVQFRGVAMGPRAGR